MFASDIFVYVDGAKIAPAMLTETHRNSSHVEFVWILRDTLLTASIRLTIHDKTSYLSVSEHMGRFITSPSPWGVYFETDDDDWQLVHKGDMLHVHHGNVQIFKAKWDHPAIQEGLITLQKAVETVSVSSSKQSGNDDGDELVFHEGSVDSTDDLYN